MSTAILKDELRADVASGNEAEIRALIAALYQTHYQEDDAVFSLTPPLSHRGVDVAEKQVWFDSGEDPVELESRDLAVAVSGDAAFCHGFRRMSGAKRNSARINFWMRVTVCLERAGLGRTRGSWRIIHERASASFYMEASVRPAFDLLPRQFHQRSKPCN
jgi:ketosteroid isomerase-like protein